VRMVWYMVTSHLFFPGKERVACFSWRIYTLESVQHTACIFIQPINTHNYLYIFQLILSD
jgi:hypothetical protein